MRKMWPHQVCLTTRESARSAQTSVATMTSKKIFIAIYLIANCTLNTWAQGQNSPKPSGKSTSTAPPAGCPATKDLKAQQLYGLWTARFVNPTEGLPITATMLLEQHAEFSDSLAGMVSRNLGAASGSAKIAGHAAKAFLAGDLEEGMLILDESSDNLSITGTWNGEMVAGSCGRIFKGSWKDTSKSAPPDAPDVPFTLTRQR